MSTDSRCAFWLVVAGGGGGGGGGGSFVVSAASSVSQAPASYDQAPSVTITPLRPMNPPTDCKARSVGTPGDKALAIQLACNGDAPSYNVVASPAHGSLQPSGNGSVVTYTPAVDYVGPDSFTYSASNAAGSAPPATVSINVEPPLCTPRTVSVPANDSVTIHVVCQGTPMLLFPTATPDGTIRTPDGGIPYPGTRDGNIVYRPKPGFTGEDSITYYWVAQVQRNAAVIRVTVTPAASP